MIKCFSTVLLLISIIWWSCKPRLEDNALPQISEFIVDSVYLPISEGSHQKLKIKEIKGNRGDRDLISFVKELNFKIYTYDLKNLCYIDSIDISRYRHGYTDFAPINADSFLIVNESNKVILVTKNKTREWSADCISQKVSKYAFIAYLSAEPLHVFGDTIMVTTASSVYSTDDTKPDSISLKVNNDVVLRLHNDSVLFVTMNNPNPAYFYQQAFHSYPERAFIDNKKIVYTYRHSDTISIFDLATRREKRKKFVTQNFHKNRPFDYSKLGDFRYIMEYEYEQSRNNTGDLYYDRFRHRIYQTLHHKGQYIDSVTGQKNKTEDIPSSIFVFDENLNQLKEVYVPGKTLTYSQFSFITKSGLYYAQAFSKQKYHDKMLFYRIVFN